MDDIEYDMEHASQQGLTRDVSKLLLFFTETCTLLRKSVKPQKTSTHSVMVDLSLQQHLQQDDTAKEADGAVRSFIMHRFLRAAEVVAAEHESSISFSKKKNCSKPPSPSLPQQSRRTPITHRIKSSAQQAPEGFANSPPTRFMSGLSCKGLKTVVFHAHRTVDPAPGHSNFRKKGWVSHPLYHMKVSNEGTSSISSEIEGPVARKKNTKSGHMTKHQSAINTDVPVLYPLMSGDFPHVKESHRRHAIKYQAGFFRNGYPGSDGCTNAGCNPSLSQSLQAKLAGNQFDNSPHDDYGWARKSATTALKEQEIETVQKGMAPCNEKQICDSKSACFCDHAKNLPPHDLADENMSRNTSRGYMGGSETKGHKPMHEDGKCDEDSKFKFCDALSGLNSVKSSTIFYTSGSPTSESSKVPGFEDERINIEMDFTEASSHFETSHASTSANNSVPLHVCTTNEKGMPVKMSSLHPNVGKNLKLETESKQAELPRNHDACAYEQKHEHQQAELRAKSFSRLRHSSLDSLSGLYLSKASTIFPVFPAKCRNNPPSTLGWPFGIYSNHLSRVEGSSYHTQQEKNSIHKLAVGEKVPCPPLPPAPTESWLGHAVTKNTSKTSLLASLQQKEKVALSRRKLKCQSVDLDAERKLDIQVERRWEDVVKGSQVHSGRLGYLEELQILMRTSL